MTLDLPVAQARRVALAAQGFGVRQPSIVGATQLRRTQDRLGLFQIDSVNVMTRALSPGLFAARRL